MERPTFPIQILMQCRQLESRWADEVWEALGVSSCDAAEPMAIEKLAHRGALAQYVVKGFCLELFRDEAEGYYLNVSAAEPKVFVMWRKEGDADLALPVLVTASYGEAARALDSGENVDAVPMPPEILRWVNVFVQQNYKPEPRKQRRTGDKPSFQSKR
jgi:hypothetical protein